eukprot:gene23001-30192_t
MTASSSHGAGSYLKQGVDARSSCYMGAKHILKREVAKFEQEHILKGTALGELDHPNYASRYFKCLNLANASHQVLDVEWRGEQLWGSIEILATPSGLLLWELYSQGIRLGVSSRGWASLRTDNKQKCVYVDDDFELITFDFVTEPSTKDAYLVPVRKQYKFLLPDQARCVSLAHMGHGVVSMRNISKLPELAALVNRINQLQALLKIGSEAEQVSLRTYPTGLDKLLLFSHYVVFPEISRRNPKGGDEASALIKANVSLQGEYPSSVAVAAGMPPPHLNDQQQQQQRISTNKVYPQPSSSTDATGWNVHSNPTADESETILKSPEGVPLDNSSVNLAAAYELQLIRGTLQRYAKQYMDAQLAMQAELHLDLPSRRAVSVLVGSRGW